MAFVDNKPVAFKLGYELDKARFYSWLGGVLPAYRGHAIARALMNLQHQWCRGQGFTSVETKTQNRWQHMLILNIKSGFIITGFEPEPEDSKILMEKKL
ncbi:MAG: hypothetical protein C5B49_13040 [Bdellovibrio sp.]|nr:MAG: hypothetical protein C5B49_13040 [Bdellovibrio sp.]